MKKPSTLRTILLTLLIIPYTLGVFSIFSSYFNFYYRPAFQTQIATSKKEELKILTFDSKELAKINWVEVNKEFEFEGKMYDVAKIEKKGSGVLIYCDNDTLEDLFINWLKTGGKSISKIIMQVHFFEPIAYFECTLSEWKCERPNNFYSDHYLSVISELITPPPRFV